MSEVTEEKPTFESFKDIKSIDELDFSKIELIRGATPQDITEKCLKLCKDYLSGDWELQTIDTIQVKRVSGGLTNQLYHCATTEPNPSSQTPQEVAIRLYGPKYWEPTGHEGNERMPDVIVQTMVSQNKLGPHTYGLFEGGQILKYYKNRQFVKEDQKNSNVVQQVFSKLARIHALDVPIKRGYEWLFKKVNKSYEKCWKDPEFLKELEEYNCQTMIENDVKAEIDFCRRAVLKCGSPVVFTHNDYRSSNLMITEPNDELVVTDFEYACYGFRGHDFVYLFWEWGRDQWDFKPSEVKFPDEDTFGPLIQIYVDESEKIFGKEWSRDPKNSVHNIFNEIKVHFLHSCFLDIMFMVDNDPDAENSFPMSRKVSMEFAELIFKTYFTMKQQLIDEKLIEP